MTFALNNKIMIYLYEYSIVSHNPLINIPLNKKNNNFSSLKWQFLIPLASWYYLRKLLTTLLRGKDGCV